jgi:uncharacterized protein
MHINLESADQYSVQAYSDSQVKINDIAYQRNLIVNNQGVLDWSILTIHELDETRLQEILSFTPEVIIIGHTATGKFPPFSTINYLSQKRIGIECMSIGAACRTYNVLLSEHREVVLGIIFGISPG